MSFPNASLTSLICPKADVQDDNVLVVWSLKETLLSNTKPRSLTESMGRVKVPYPEGQDENPEVLISFAGCHIQSIKALFTQQKVFRTPRIKVAHIPKNVAQISSLHVQRYCLRGTHLLWTSRMATLEKREFLFSMLKENPHTHTRTVKSSQGPAEVVRQPQPQEVSTHVILQAPLEPIVNCVSAEVTRQLSSSSGDWKTNDHQLSDQISDEHVTGNAPGAEQMSEVPLAGILGKSPSQSVIQGSVTQFQETSGETYEP